jgi:hypothetical protein
MNTLDTMLQICLLTSNLIPIVELKNISTILRPSQ